MVRKTDNDPSAVLEMQTRFVEAGADDLIRFLQARNFDVERAANMYQAHLQWREETLPIPYESVKDTLATRKFYLLNDTDAAGHPVFFYSLHRFKQAPYVVEDEIKALVYLIENEVMPKMGETQQWSVLIDVSGIRSPPLAFLHQMNAVMEANYPERLFRSIMFPVPTWLQRIIQGFLVLIVDEDTRAKFAYVHDVKSLEEAAMMPKEHMGPDIAERVKNRQM